MSHVLHRSLDATLPTVVGGDGNFLIDESGKRYLDACGGAAVSCLGHDNERVRSAIKRQIDRVAFAHTSFFTNEPAEELASFLVERAPEGTGDGRVMFLGSGSEAMEAALKLARQYHLERGEAARTRIIARAPSYHGNTLGALATGGHAGRRAPFRPLLMDVGHIDAAYEYRMRHDGESEAAFAERMANLLDQRIRELGPDTVMAFVAEPVVGASLGTQPAPRGYFQRIREICDRHGVLLIADEVMCGMGRTGSLFALEQEGIAADITTLAKGLGAGFQPIAAVMAAEKVVAAIQNGSGLLWNGHTYMSHAVATAGALAVQKVIQDQNLLENVRARGEQLRDALNARFGQNPNIGDVRGRGLFWTVELVADKASKASFPAAARLSQKIQRAALDLGLMCYPAQGCADGTNGDHVLLAPSYTSTPDEIARIVDLLARAVETVLNKVEK
ncbi:MULTISPECIES: aspartate aminotransferase family protein [Rhizobium/Agrobacterium group]|uniref:Aspartate aminotransferase family protein n=2 Tax=Rhizobium/Agrobacterium group TaxID=227290 RepID=A0A9X3KQJ1_9HYPH|nr:MULTISPECIES: aspartate aminotransferase family protein [Rhizobium/Agrobacterium group]MBO9126214.1 aspartate aminotransferase family protein [Rhizobium sp. 16-488-2b]MBO9176798.1 aspartate aminotransferase family protein [Rhizobium sp. 16-488-2a]MBO9197367.1 aspartate aminotransferase family protein [Rhizobium sp. 16-449-1b]MCZ7466772.1 aspartate aminotransferase family protein [Rhizobium rhizogenes]MCZ7939198.1 aspartate aminotransferase family protein [Agrobacterium salinitolerans]